MTSERRSKKYEKLFSLYAERFPKDSHDVLEALMEINLKELMREGKSKEESILELSERLEATNRKIRDYERRIERLSVLFAENEISEESYKVAIKTIENKLSQLKDEPYGEEVEKEPEIYEEREVIEEIVTKPSSLWYLVPFFFGFIGGLLGYIAVKDEDRDMAASLIFFGIFMTLVYIFLAWQYIEWVLSSIRNWFRIW